MSAPTIMVQGTSSSVGKSLLVTALCRWFRRAGVRVAPFKSQNMALNAAVTPDGREMGRAQAVQAEAAGLVPHVDMNPILIKPEGDARSQIVVMDRVTRTVQLASRTPGGQASAANVNLFGCTIQDGQLSMSADGRYLLFDSFRPDLIGLPVEQRAARVFVYDRIANTVLHQTPGNVGATGCTGGISADGRHGFTLGFMTITADGKPERKAKYLSYWVKGPEGWRVAVFKRNGRPDGEVSLTLMPASLPEAPLEPATGPTAELYRTSLDKAERAFSDLAQKIGLGRLGKKPTNVITNATLKTSGGNAHVTTTNAQTAIQMPRPLEPPRETPEMAAAREQQAQRANAAAQAETEAKAKAEQQRKLEERAARAEEGYDGTEDDASEFTGTNPPRTSDGALPMVRAGEDEAAAAFVGVSADWLERAGALGVDVDVLLAIADQLILGLSS